VARGVVALGDAERDRLVDLGDGLALQAEVRLEVFGHGLADVEGAELLEIRHAFQEEDAFGQVAGVLHLADGFLVVLFGETVETPVLAHLGVQEVLVDADELARKHVVQRLDDLLAPLHSPLRARTVSTRAGSEPGGSRKRLAEPLGLDEGQAWAYSK